MLIITSTPMLYHTLASLSRWMQLQVEQQYFTFPNNLMVFFRQYEVCVSCSLCAFLVHLVSLPCLPYLHGIPAVSPSWRLLSYFYQNFVLHLIWSPCTTNQQQALPLISPFPVSVSFPLHYHLHVIVIQPQSGTLFSNEHPYFAGRQSIH